jgi:hypothetical protein
MGTKNSDEAAGFECVLSHPKKDHRPKGGNPNKKTTK